jgi:hypothetical protein
MRPLTLEDPNQESQDLDDADTMRRSPDEDTKRIEKLDLDLLIPEFLS